MYVCGSLSVFMDGWLKKEFYVQHLLDSVRLSGRSSLVCLFWCEDLTKSCAHVNPYEPI